MNHTSDEHPWFLASRDPNHPEHDTYKDFYVWSEGSMDADGNRIPPNNWVSITDRDFCVQRVQDLGVNEDYQQFGNNINSMDGVPWYVDGELTDAGRTANIEVIRQHSSYKHPAHPDDVLTVRRVEAVNNPHYTNPETEDKILEGRPEPKDMFYMNYLGQLMLNGEILFQNGSMTEAAHALGFTITGEPGTAWKYDDVRQAYYLHNFAENMPDLNFRSPLDPQTGQPVYDDGLNAPLMDEVKDIIEFWKGKGVNGFRLDAIPYFVQGDLDQNATDVSSNAAFAVRHQHVAGQALTADVLRSIKQACGDDVACLGEGWIPAPLPHENVPLAIENALIAGTTYATELVGSGAVDSIYTGGIAGCEGYAQKGAERYLRQDMQTLAQAFDKAGVPNGINWASENHDMNRVLERWGITPGTREARDEAAKTVIAMTLSLPGSTCVYQGQELGLPNATPYKMARSEEEGRAQYDPKAGGLARMMGSWEGGRGPLPMTADQKDNAWVKMPAEYREYAADEQRSDVTSVYSYTKVFLERRRDSKALSEGNFRMIHGAPDGMVAFTRQHSGPGQPVERMLCLFNLTDQELVLTTLQDADKNPVTITVPPYGRVVEKSHHRIPDILSEMPDEGQKSDIILGNQQQYQ